MSIEAFCASRAAVGRAPATVAWYRRNLLQFELWSGLALAEARSEDLERFLAARRRDGLKPNSIACLYRSLSAYYGWALRRGLVERNPLKIVDAPRVPRAPGRRTTLEQYHQLVAVCAGDGWLDARDRLLLVIAFFSGLRVGELVALHVEDLDATHGVLVVRAGKGGNARFVPMHPDVRPALLDYLYRRPRWEGPELFLAADGPWGGARGPLTTNGVRQMFRRRCQAAGLPRLNPHSLRHGFATTLLNAGASLASISHMMGHSSTRLTESIYAAWLVDGLTREYRAAVKRLEE
jgi:site-specific recombinase XerD